MEWFQLPVLVGCLQSPVYFPAWLRPAPGLPPAGSGLDSAVHFGTFRLRPGLTAPGVTGEVEKAKVAYCRAGVDLGLPLPAPKRASKPKPRCPSLGHACSWAAPASLAAPLTDTPAGDALKKH